MVQAMLVVLSLLFGSCSTFSTHSHYSRDEWRHWIDDDNNCLDTRNEILKRRSSVVVKMKPSGCNVTAGQWQDYYHPETHYKANAVDIDHLIPLKHAHESGGASWSVQEKELFANDPDNLVITNKKYNRQKGSKRIDQWLPVHKEYACKYIRDWIRIKNKYKLQFSREETSAIELAACP